MARDPLIYVDDALDEISFLAKLLAGRDKHSFLNDPTAFRASAYSLLKISEACRNIPENWLNRAPLVNWKGVYAIGNKIRHEYFRLDEDIMWDVLTGRLAELESALELIKRG